MEMPFPDAIAPLPTDPRERLLRLHELARHWLTEVNPPGFRDKRGNVQPEAPEGATFAYSDLMFAFGLARSAAEPAARLAQSAGQTLGQTNPLAAWLLEAFAYRIEQALQGRPHQGPLPASLLGRLERLESIEHYAVDRLRQNSRILEPDQGVDPYQRFLTRATLDGQLGELTNLTDCKDLAVRVERLFQEAPTLDRYATAVEAQARVLKAGLSLAPRVGEDFALQLLVRLGPVLDALPRPAVRDWDGQRSHAEVLKAALFAAAHFRRVDHVQALVGRYQNLLKSYGRTALAVRLINYLGGESVRGLHLFGLRRELEQLLTQMAGLVLGSQEAPDLDALLRKTFAEEWGRRDSAFEAWVEALRALLRVAAGWYWLGRDSEARAVLDTAHATLVQGKLLATHRSTEQLRLACDYAKAAAQAPVAEAQRRFEELFRHVKVWNSWSTAGHYALAQLWVIETVVLAVARQDIREASPGDDAKA